MQNTIIRLKVIILILCTQMLSACDLLERKNLIAIIGDSATANQPVERGPQGYGYYLESDTVKNFSRSGSSSKSFYEDFWPDILKMKPQLVIIQFGLNDCKLGQRYTDPNTTYKEFNEKYYKDTQKLGIDIVFVTTPNRRIGKSVLPYVNSIKNLAKEKKIPIIDLYEYSLVVQNKYKDDINAVYFDGTHTNAKGAELFGNFVKTQLKLQGILLEK